MKQDTGFRIRFALAAVAFVALAIGSHAMILDHLPAVFNSPEEDLSFAWYVPIFACYVLWVEKERLSPFGAATWRRDLLPLLPLALVAALAQVAAALKAGVPFLSFDFLCRLAFTLALVLLPFLGLLVVWIRRERGIEPVRGPPVPALLVLLPALAMAFLGGRGLQVRFELIAFSLLLVLLPWFCFGPVAA